MSCDNATNSMDTWNDSTTDVAELFEFTWQNCLYILLASLMSLTTVVANVVLIILVCVDVRLRRNSNYYITSLACADLLVGAFVIPMFSLYTILGRWPLGSFVCELWIIVDFTCVSASVFSICMISINRYWAIIQPVKYLQRRHKERALFYVGTIWVLAILSWVPAALAHRFTQGSFETDSACVYLPGFVYVVVSNTIIYFIPMGLMVFLYINMLLALRKNYLKLQRANASAVKHLPVASARKLFLCCHVYGETTTSESTLMNSKNLSLSTISLKVYSSTLMDDSQITLPHAPVEDLSRSQTSTADIGALSSLSQGLEGIKTRSCRNALGNRALRIHQYRLHQRRARMLGIIIAAFLVCWSPFVVMFPINSYCSCIPMWLYDMSYCLAYLNSTLNPFLYGFNKEFRDALRRMISPMNQGKSSYCR